VEQAQILKIAEVRVEAEAAASDSAGEDSAAASP